MFTYSCPIPPIMPFKRSWHWFPFQQPTFLPGPGFPSSLPLPFSFPSLLYYPWPYNSLNTCSFAAGVRRCSCRRILCTGSSAACQCAHIGHWPCCLTVEGFGDSAKTWRNMSSAPGSLFLGFTPSCELLQHCLLARSVHMVMHPPVTWTRGLTSPAYPLSWCNGFLCTRLCPYIFCLLSGVALCQLLHFSRTKRQFRLLPPKHWATWKVRYG